jgi:hypothetical protein
MKYWQIRSKADELSYYAYAPNEMAAIKAVETLMGPQNPSNRIVRELAGCPEGYQHASDESQLLEPVE